MTDPNTFDLPGGRTHYELLWQDTNIQKLFRRTVTGTAAKDIAAPRVDYVVADDSAWFPHDCEDGPLVIDLTQVINIKNNLRAAVPAKDSDGDPCMIEGHINLVLALKRVTKINVAASASLEAQMVALRELFPAIFDDDGGEFTTLDRDEKHAIITNMVGRNCGHFMSKVADAWFTADSTNRAKLERAYGNKFIAYR